MRKKFAMVMLFTYLISGAWMIPLIIPDEVKVKFKNYLINKKYPP